MKRAPLTFFLALFLLACSSGGEEAEKDEHIFMPFDMKQPPKKDVQPIDVVTEIDDAGAPETDLFEPDLTDLPDIFYPEFDVPLIDSVEIETEEVETVEQDLTALIEPGFGNYGSMTISPKGILIGGQYEQLRFARVDYWKFPAERWDYLMDMADEAGFNGIATAACWRRHEKAQGIFDFTTGNLALGDFLDKAAARGLYVYFYAGPWIDGEALGCMPDWLTSQAGNLPSPVADGKLALRISDADFTGLVSMYFDQLNPIVGARQWTGFQQGYVLFYQLESAYDVFYFLKDAEAKISQEMLGIPVPPLNAGLYLAQLKEAVTMDGITLPLLTSITGDFENGGKHVFGTGDTPGILPAFIMDTRSPYKAMELKLAQIRKEMRTYSLHSKTYEAAPGVAVGVLPSATHLARTLMGGADAVVVKGFAAALLPLEDATLGLNTSGTGLFSDLESADVAFGPALEDYPALLTASGVPRDSYFEFRMLNLFMERFGPAFAGRDQPMRIGPNKSVSPFELEVLNEEVGAIEDHWTWPEAGMGLGIQEVMADNFADWFQFTTEATGRATYFFDSSDGTLLVHLLNLDGLDGDKNKHERQDLITKVVFNGSEIPRHSNIVVPASDDIASGEPYLGWGGKFLVINHPLGPGYPTLEYSTANIAAIEEFNDRLLMVLHGKPTIKSEGIFFTEAGEISLANFGGIPDVVHNSLNGGGVFADTGGKLAVQFQHDETGFLTISLPGGQQLEVMATTTDLAKTIHFATNFDFSKIAIFGLLRVEETEGIEGGLIVKGKIDPATDRIAMLTTAPPYTVEVDGKEVDCEYDQDTLLLDCEVQPDAPLEGSASQGETYMKQESYTGSPSELGIDYAPDAFTTMDGLPPALQTPGISVTNGVAWYVTEVTLGPIPPGQQGFLKVEGVSDLVSVFLNGTYVGSSMGLGNSPMTPMDVSMGLPAAGFRIPGGLLQQGLNTVALRVFTWGHPTAGLPMVYSAAPLLPPELDPFAAVIPHLAIAGLNPVAGKGVQGSATITVGVSSTPLPGPWTVSVGDANGTGRTLGMLQGWHSLAPAESAATNNGFNPVPEITEEISLPLLEGQFTWVTRSFSSEQLTAEGGFELAIAGRSALAMVFLNGLPIGVWASDEESISQGLHSELVQGVGTRQLLADLSHGHFFSSEDTIPLPWQLLGKSGGLDNRVSCLVMDISPATDIDLVIPSIGTISGLGKLTRFEVLFNTAEAYQAGGSLEGSPAYWKDVEVALLPPPPPEE